MPADDADHRESKIKFWVKHVSAIPLISKMRNLLPSLVDIKLRSFGGLTSEHVARYELPGASGSRVFREPWRPDAEGFGGGARGPLQIVSPRKEVIQPHLPAYGYLVTTSPPHPPHLRRLRPFEVRPAASGADDWVVWTGRCVQGRERIHRGVLIAITSNPASRRRVAACGPNWGRL